MFTASGEPFFQKRKQAEILLVETSRRWAGAFDAPSLDARARHDRADLGEHGRELLLRCSCEGREGILRYRGRVGLLARQRFDQFLPDADL